MGVHLEKIEISTFRGISHYSIDNLKGWTSITSPNSTGKSSIINAISFLGSNRMHESSDIPSWFKPTEVNPREVPFEITYRFKLNKSFEKLMSDERIVENLVSTYEWQLKHIPEKNENEPYTTSLRYALMDLEKKPLGKILKDALYETIRDLFERFPNYDPYKPLFDSANLFKMPEEIFKDARFLQITLSLTISDGPDISFSLLDEQANPLIVDEVFFHWLNHQHAINDVITLSFVIGAVFIKCVINPSLGMPEVPLPPTILASDGSNIRQYLGYCLAHHPNILKKVTNDFERVFGQAIQFKMTPPGSSFEEDEILIEMSGRNGWFPIYKLSDGMFHVLRILLQLASCNKGDILVIDEPELYLHPGAARCLRDILVERISEIQIICATHSPIFIDPYVVDIIILNKNIDDIIKPQILEAKGVDLALSELGSSGLDALLYDIVIWVEGPSDKVYLERWLQIFQNELKNLTNPQVGILPYGGKSMLRHLEIEEIKSINRKSIFVIDSDKKAVNDEIDSHTNDFISKCNENGIYCWTTKKREIENYIPVDILREKLNLNSDMLSISEYDDVIEKLKEVGKNFNKVKLAKTVAPSITIEHIKKDEEFYNELKDLIKNLNTAL